LDEVGVRLLNFGIVPQSCQTLEPIVELHGIVDLFRPVVHEVEIVHEKVACFVIRSYDEIVLAFFEEPF
jgi:hypothetical protein